MKLYVTLLLVMCIAADKADYQNNLETTSQCLDGKEIVEDVGDRNSEEKGFYSEAVTKIGEKEVSCTRDLEVITLFTSESENLNLEVSNTHSGSQKGYSTAQAIELLVSRWNDLASWPQRHELSSECQLDVEAAIKGYLSNEMWALHLFDAWAKPGPSLLLGRTSYVGNLYQCRDTSSPFQAKRPGFKGNYCVVTLVNLTNDLELSAIEEPAHKILKLGVCLPSSCSPTNTNKLLQERIEILKLSSLVMAVTTDCRSDAREYTIFTIIAITIIVVIAVLTLIGTTIDTAQAHSPKPTSFNNDQHNNTLVQDERNKTNISTNGNKERVNFDTENVSSLTTILLSFSVWRNGQKLLIISDNSNSINAISGIRFFTMVWIIAGHVNHFLLVDYSDNFAERFPMMAPYSVFKPILTFSYGVDTFFAISGFLVSYHWITPIMDKGWQLNWRYFFFHRYWRLTTPYMIIFVLNQGLQPFLVSGAMAPTLLPSDKLSCEESWWQLPLYIHNLVGSRYQDMCVVISWSIDADMQFYVLSPLMLIPFYYHKKAGITSCLLIVLVQWIYVGITSYNYGWTLDGNITAEWIQYLYFPFYARIAPFAFGILAGSILTINGGRVQMTQIQVAIGWTLASVTAIVQVFIYYNPNLKYTSVLHTAIFYATSKSIWSLCVLWVIIVCASGYGGPVNIILSWSPFIVLGRLTYSGYLISEPVINILFENSGRTVDYSLTILTIYTIVSTFVSCLMSVVLTVCIEYPMLNLERKLFWRIKINSSTKNIKYILRLIVFQGL